MPAPPLHIGVVTDEISRTLTEALEFAQEWGLSRFELREGSQNRFPRLTRGEVAAVEDARSNGAQITAVSPGIFKGAADDEATLSHELGYVLPRAIELAIHFGCPLLIGFGFERYADEPAQNRVRAMKAFEQAASQVADAGMRFAIENEPNFWIDRADPSAAMLDEVGHPALRLNWDPANSHWGGQRPTYADFKAIKPYLANVHVKDYTPERPDAPWVPVGEGVTPWADIFPWIIEESDLEQVTLETHCQPLIASSRRSLKAVRLLIDQAYAGR